MNSAAKAGQWAAIRALCEGEAPSLELVSAASGISLAALEACSRKIIERQAGEGTAAA